MGRRRMIATRLIQVPGTLQAKAVLQDQRIAKRAMGRERLCLKELAGAVFNHEGKKEEQCPHASKVVEARHSNHFLRVVIIKF